MTKAEILNKKYTVDFGQYYKFTNSIKFIFNYISMSCSVLTSIVMSEWIYKRDLGGDLARWMWT